MSTSADAPAVQRCINPACAASYPIRDVLTGCPACGALLDIAYDWAHLPGTPRDWRFAEARAKAASCLDASGVWRFRELLPFFEHERDIVSIGEGKTILQRADALAVHVGFDGGSALQSRLGDTALESRATTLYLQYEGLNPSGSFKDNGMTAAFTHARMVGAKVCACASTGNTSASMAVYACAAGMKAVVFIGEGKIALGKLSQALDYGALTLQVAGDFDACLARVKHIAENPPDPAHRVYLMNSVNPFRLEGQKAVMFRVLEGLGWRVPDWIIVPGGNLGNCSAFGKAFMELRELGLVDRTPRLAVINAQGARTLDRVYNELGVRWNGGAYFTDGGAQKVEAELARMDRANERARTIASAIEINRPVNLSKALRALEVMTGDAKEGVVRSVSDDAIREYKALVGRFGYGCEPASAASVAGADLLRREGLIKPGQTVVCILTGHVLKDPDVTVGYHMGLGKDGKPENGAPARYANAPVRVADDLEAIVKAMSANG